MESNKKTILSILKELQQISDLENSEFNFPKETLILYENLKNWLISNGAIFPNFSFPISYSKQNNIGVKTLEKIPPNFAMFFIPSKLLIDSEKISIESEKKFIQDDNTLKIVYFLIKESKKSKSFFEPYLNFILNLDYSNFPVFWENDDFEELKNKDLEERILSFKNEINVEENNLRNFSDLKDFEPIVFKKFYSFCISRQFNIQNKRTLLVPFADLLNHNVNVDVKYEIFDSENFVMKFTSEFDNNEKNDFYTNCEYFFKSNENKKNPNENKIIFDKNYFESNNNKLTINENDYFVISTNSEQFFDKNSQVFNNYGKSSNSYLLINYGFTLIDNPYDKLNLQINSKNIEKTTKNFIFEKLPKNLTNHELLLKKDIASLSFFIHREKLSKKLLMFFRFINYLGRGKFENYKFMKKVEIETLNSYLNFINTCNNNFNVNVFKYTAILRDLINKNDTNINQKNIIIYKLTQKVNLEFHKDYINFLIKIVKNEENEIKCYKDLIEKVKNEKEFKSLFLDLETVKKVVLNYIENVDV